MNSGESLPPTSITLNKDASKTYQQLQKLKSGKYSVDREGKLHRKGLIGKIKDIFSNPNKNNDPLTQVRITGLVKTIRDQLKNSTPKIQSDSISSNELSTEEGKSEIPPISTDKINVGADKIKELFFECLVQLPESLFKRDLIKEDSVLEKVLTQDEGIELIKARQNYSALEIEGLENANIQKLDEALLELAEQEAIFSLKLGVMPENVGTTSYSLALRDRMGKKIAIYKPWGLGPHGKENPSFNSKIKRIITPLLGYGSIDRDREHVGEVINFKASLQLNTLNVPSTKISQLALPILKKNNPITGSLQLFIHGTEPADKVFAEELDRKTNSFFKKLKRFVGSKPKTSQSELNQPPITESLFRHLAILDFVTGQMDRHFGNWLIISKPTEASASKKPSSVSGRIAAAVPRIFHWENDTAIAAIDGGGCFPVHHSHSRFEIHNQYKWGLLDLAQAPIVPDKTKQITTELIENVTNKEWQDRFITECLGIALQNEIDMYLSELPGASFSFLNQENKRKVIKSLLKACPQIKTREEFEKRPSLKEIEAMVLAISHLGLDEDFIQSIKEKLIALVQKIRATRERLFVLQLTIERKLTLADLSKLRTESELKKFVEEYYSQATED